MDQTPDESRSPVTPTSAAGNRSGEGLSVGALPEVVVRVLGPVDVVGAARAFARAWTLDLVAYLAVHPGGVRADAWESALWPDRLLAAATRHSTVSAARRSLGRASDGSERLSRREGRLRLGPSVTSDWAQFCALARAVGPTAPDAWHAALALVRGRAFDGLRALDWTVLEGYDAEVQDTVVQVALRLAEHLLSAGDGRRAELALRRGLLVSPYDERLYRLLLVAADRQGNPGGVEAVMAQLLRLTAGWRSGDVRRAGSAPTLSALDPASLESVHPETASLYCALSRRRDRAAAPCSGRPKRDPHAPGLGERCSA